MWRRYFRQGRIVGIDLKLPDLEIPGVEMYIGDQSDPAFLASLVSRCGGFDIVIDDGSHVASHIAASFDVLFDALRPGGWSRDRGSRNFVLAKSRGRPAREPRARRWTWPGVLWTEHNRNRASTTSRSCAFSTTSCSYGSRPRRTAACIDTPATDEPEAGCGGLTLIYGANLHHPSHVTSFDVTSFAACRRELTIEQLAAQTGMSVRNIRAHQARGLLAAPEVRLRVGYYGPEHVARLKLIRELQDEGFNLASIKHLLDDGESVRPAAGPAAPDADRAAQRRALRGADRGRAGPALPGRPRAGARRCSSAPSAWAC